MKDVLCQYSKSHWENNQAHNEISYIKKHYLYIKISLWGQFQYEDAGLPVYEFPS